MHSRHTCTSSSGLGDQSTSKSSRKYSKSMYLLAQTHSKITGCCIGMSIPRKCREFIDSRYYDGRNLSQWVWIKVVRSAIKAYLQKQSSHQTPTSNIEDAKVAIPLSELWDLSDDFTSEELWEDFSKEFNNRAEQLYARVGRPTLTRHTAWSVFGAMVAQLNV